MVLHYENRHFIQAESCAGLLLEIEPQDAIALFYRGAARLHLGSPGQIRIDEAFEEWSKAVDCAESADVQDLEKAIEREFSTTVYGFVNRDATFWRTYDNARYAEALVGDLTALERCAEAWSAKASSGQRSAKLLNRLMRGSRWKWIALVTGVDMPIPLEATASRIAGCADVLSCVRKSTLVMMDDVSNLDDPALLVAKRALSAFERFSIHYENVHGEWKAI